MFKKISCPQKVGKITLKSCSENLKSTFFSLLPWLPKQPKQKNSCSKMWPIDQLYIKLGFDHFRILRSLRITYRQHCGWKKRTPCLWRLVCHFCRMYFSNPQLTEIFSEASYLSWDLFWNINRNNIAKICFLVCQVQGPNVSTTPITAMGCRHCLPLSVVQLKGSLLFSPIQILFIIFFNLMFESEVGFYRSWKKH